MTKLGEKLKQLRFKKGMTQGDLAVAININKASVSNYERGHRNPPYAVICAMAEALEVHVDELLACIETEESSAEDVSMENQINSIRQRRVRKLLAAFDKLSDDAQLKAVERVEELGMIPAYQRKLMDVLQQYVYNRCRIKMEPVEDPVKRETYEGDDSKSGRKEWQCDVRHITLQHGTDGNDALRWDFYYYSFEKTVEDERVIKHIVESMHASEEYGSRVAFVFDDETAFNSFHDQYKDKYDEMDAASIPIPDSAWALFLLVDKETWEIKDTMEYDPYE